MSRNHVVTWRRMGGAAVVWLALGTGVAGAEEARAVESPQAEAVLPAAVLPAPAAAGPASVPARAPVPPAVTLGQEALIGEITVKGRRETRTESLEAREVRERGARDLGEALSSLPSLDKVRKGGIANDLVLRGMKKDDVAVTIDGAKVHGACPSRMDPPTFHLDWAEVDVVQVKRGPFDVSRTGSLGGAIDVRTRRGHEGLGTELNLEGGSAGMMSGSATVSGGAGGIDALVGAAYKEGSPYVAGDGKNFTEVIPAGNGARFRDVRDGQQAYRVGSGFARVGMAPATGQRIELGYTRQSALRVLYPYLKMDGIADDTDRATARWTAGALGPVAATVEGYWSRVAHDMTDVWRCSSAASVGSCAGSVARGYAMGTFARSEVWGGQAELRGGDLDASVAWKAGADLYVRSWDNRTDRLNRMTATYGSERSIPDVTVQGAGLYGEGRRALGARTRVIAGVRVDASRSEAAVDRTALYRKYYPGADLARSRDDVLVGGNLQVEQDLAAGLLAWVGYGHGTRLPDPQERYIALTGMGGNPDWVGRPDLSPVQSDEADLGVTWRAPRLVVKVQLFHAWYASYVNVVNVAAAPGSTAPLAGRSYRNVAARVFGGEASGRIALPAHLFVTGSAAFTRGINDSAGGTSLSEISPFKATVALRWDDGRFFAEAAETWAARQGFVDGALLETPTPAWWTTSVKAGVGLRGVKVFATVQNVFDRYYVEHLSYQRDPFATGIKVPEPGRTLLVAAQYAY